MDGSGTYSPENRLVPMVNITFAAKQKIKDLLKNKQDKIMRIYCVGGGISGIRYSMVCGGMECSSEFDHYYDFEEFKIVCDPKSNIYIDNLILDYQDETSMNVGFSFSVSKNITPKGIVDD